MPGRYGRAYFFSDNFEDFYYLYFGFDDFLSQYGLAWKFINALIVV